MTEDNYELPQPRPPLSRSDILEHVRWMGEVRKQHRKALLTLCAICRTTWDHVIHPSNRRALEASEDFADGLITSAELDQYWSQTRFEPVIYCEWVCNVAGEEHRLANIDPSTDQHERELMLFQEEHEQKTLIHWREQEVTLAMDVININFRDTSMHDDWRTTTATAIASQMYDSREFGAMPVLADALQDAGCENADILDHCRGPGPHVRGCWVVDLLLGKE